MFTQSQSDTSDKDTSGYNIIYHIYIYYTYNHMYIYIYILCTVYNIIYVYVLVYSIPPEIKFPVCAPFFAARLKLWQWCVLTSAAGTSNWKLLRSSLQTGHLKAWNTVDSLLGSIKDLFIKTGLWISCHCENIPQVRTGLFPLWFVRHEASEGANCGWCLGVGAQRENVNARLQLEMLVLMQSNKLVQVFRQGCFLPRQRVGSYALIS